MPLLRKRRLRRPGLPEWVAVAALAVAVIPAVMWVEATTSPSLSQTTGRCLSCTIRLTHYNAVNNLPKVYLTYAYSVGTAEFTGQWEGFWPATNSPNALPPDKLDQLKTTGYPLTVFYDPSNPRQSYLHVPGPSSPALHAFFAIAAALAAFTYIVRIYPAWKTR